MDDLPFLKSFIATFSGLVCLLALVEELRNEYNDASACLPELLVLDPPVFGLLTIRDGAVTFKESIVWSISSRFGKISGMGSSDGSKSTLDRSAFCFMPGIFSISWVKTVDEFDVSGLNISSAISRGLREESHSLTGIGTSAPMFKPLVMVFSSEGIAGLDSDSCLGTRLNGSKLLVTSGIALR